MSKYMINKLIRAVEMHDDAVHDYTRDPAGFVDSWLAVGGTPALATDDRELTEEETAAFAVNDYAAMYRLGANPYLLWHFVEAVDQGVTPWPDLKEQYRAAITSLGEPGSIM